MGVFPTGLSMQPWPTTEEWAEYEALGSEAAKAEWIQRWHVENVWLPHWKAEREAEEKAIAERWPG